MAEILKKPYRICVYGAEYVEKNGNRYLEEYNLATIGSDTMESTIRAFNPVLNRKLNGQNTFSFTLYSRYYDVKTDEWLPNPFINLLCNERRIKLNYDGEWFDFIIKNIEENSENYSFNYTCTDLYINELSKNGFSIELNDELYNNMGTVDELASYILENSDWILNKEDQSIEYGDTIFNLPGCETIKQSNKTLLYLLSEFPSGARPYILMDANGDTYPPASKFLTDDEARQFGQVYISSVDVLANAKKKGAQCYQFIQVKADNEYVVDDEGTILNEVIYGFDAESDSISSIGGASISTATVHFAKMLGIYQIGKYFNGLGESCTLYKATQTDDIYGFEKDKEYYGFHKNHYASPDEIQNIIANNVNFVSTNGWAPLDATKASVSVQNSQLILSSGETQVFSNSGFYANREMVESFSQGEQYILKIEVGEQSTGKFLNPVVKYAQEKDSNLLNSQTLYDSDNIAISFTPNGKNEWRGKTEVNMSHEDFIKSFCSFFISVTGEVQIKKIYLYKEAQGKVSDELPVVITDMLYLVVADTIEDITSPEEAEYIKIESTQSAQYLAPVYSDNYAKVRSISAEKSNRFNILQSICETFECWVRFKTLHDPDTGVLLYRYIEIPQSEIENPIKNKEYFEVIGDASNQDSKFFFTHTNFCIAETYVDDGARKFVNDKAHYERIPMKFIYFKEFIGNENLLGFKYGINLKSINRKVVSDTITTKLIVQANSNEFAEGGAGGCTIQQADTNPTGESFIMNFEYYINKGLLDREELYKDLYSDEGINYYGNLYMWNLENQETIEKQVAINSSLIKAKADATRYAVSLEEANRNKKIYEDLLIGINGGELPTSIEAARRNGGEVGASYYTQYQEYEHQIQVMTTEKAEVDKRVKVYEELYEKLSEGLAQVIKEKEALNLRFYRKYFPYIQEGTWVDESYTNADLYYNDANEVLFTSAFPKIEYSIDVIDISRVEGWSVYTYNIGDKTTVEDVEFFGYQPDHITPIRQSIVVSEVTYNLDDASQNNIKVQNYLTQFDDLFQRISAETQALQMHEGQYQRASNVVNKDNTLNSVMLKNSFLDNELTLRNAINQSVAWDENGITVSSKDNTSEKVRIVNNGIMMTTDGGATWTTGITGNGINATSITTGQLNVNNVSLYNSESGLRTFEWSDRGISAFMSNVVNGKVTSVNYKQFVRFDKFGIYQMTGDENWTPISSEDILNKARFALTQSGLSINLIEGQQDKKIIQVRSKADTEDYMFYVDGNGRMYAREGEFSGKLNAATGSFSGTLSIGKKDNNNYNFVVDENGNVTMKGNISMPGNGSTITIGQGDNNSGQIEITSKGINIVGGAITFNGSNVDSLLDNQNYENTEVDYAISSNGKTPPSENQFSSNMPNLESEKYLWTRTRFYYIDNNTLVKTYSNPSYSVSYIAKNGTNGKDGTVSSTDVNNVIQSNYPYLTSTSIDGSKVSSPIIEGWTISGSTINGGTINITGDYVGAGTERVLYIKNGNKTLGYLGSYSSFTDAANYASNRVVLGTQNSAVLKLYSAGNMSLDCSSGSQIWAGSAIAMPKNCGSGTTGRPAYPLYGTVWFAY